MPDPVDELYTLPAREFIAARDRLAAQLAAAKQRERAREVKALKRPTVAAWVVNQLVHRNHAAIERLIDAGNALRRAQGRTIRGGSADDLRAATKKRQDALRELRTMVRPILREAGSQAHLDDVLATLEAASVDPAAARAVTSGRLSRELPRPASFGDATQLALVVSRGTRAAPQPTASRAAAVETDRRLPRALAAEAKRLEREASRSEQAAARLSRRTATLERARHEHERRVRQQREELEASERQLRDSDASLARARAEQSRAADRAAEFRRAAKEARAKADNER